MKMNLIWIGKNKFKFADKAVELYLSRLKHYCKINVIQLKDVKSSSPIIQKELEAQLFEKYLNTRSHTICLDEKGDGLTSIELSNKIISFQNRSIHNLNIMIGGAFGFHPTILNKCNEKWSLSKMTLPHDLCRIVLTEQLYRAFTIIKNEKYHNP
jgi:23S rRNA (pseudouridine1915-N3)-methyltransferase